MGVAPCARPRYEKRMCGRFDFHGDAIAIEAAFAVQCSNIDLPQRYNTAPTEFAPVVVAQGLEGGLQARSARFGWQRQFLSGGMVINARAETARTSPLFRAAFAAKRCVIPANGFYEWQKSGRSRLPWYFTSTQHPVFGFAGLFDPATDSQPAAFVILTTEPCALVAPYHNRMPVMLAPSDARAFILGSPDEAAVLLRPYDAEAMQAHRVSPVMNRAGFDGPECIARVVGVDA